MIKLDAHKAVHFCDGLTRRDFLHAGALGLGGFGLTLSDLFALKASGAIRTDKDVNCICLFLVGAPSQLDTWDMKPDAPSEIRGPYKAIKTNVPGIQISEIFPRMATHADKFALIRSVHYAGVAVHDAGHQVMQTGRLFQAGTESPHVGSILGYRQGPEGRHPAARAAAAPDRQHRRQHAARPVGRVPRQGVRPVRPRLRSVGSGLQGARPAAAGLPDRDPRRPAPQPARPGRRRRQGLRSEPRRAPAEFLVRPGLHADLVVGGPRRVRPVEGARRAEGQVRAQPLRHELSARPSADRSRRAIRDGEHVRDGVQRDHVGHPRLGARSARSRRTAICSARCSTTPTRRCSRT